MKSNTTSPEIEELEKRLEIEQLEKRLASLVEEKQKAWDTLHKITNIESEVRSELSELRSRILFPTDADITIEKVMSLPRRNVSGKLYEKVINWFRNFRFVEPYGFGVESNQIPISVVLYRNLDFEPQYEEIKQFVPYLKPISFISRTRERKLLGEKAKRLYVSEYTCCEDGYYSIYIPTDKNVALVIYRYGSLDIKKRFTDLESCLRYVQKNYWYRKTLGDR